MKWKIACLVLASLSILAITAAAQPNGAVWVGKAGKPACACECKVVLVKAGQGHCQGQCQGQCQGHCQGQCQGRGQGQCRGQCQGKGHGQCQGQCVGHFPGHGQGCQGAAGGRCSGQGPGEEFLRGFRLGYLQGLAAGRGGCGHGQHGLQGAPTGCCGGHAKVAGHGCQCKSRAASGCKCGSKPNRNSGFTYGWSSTPPSGCRCGQRVVMQKRIEVNAVRGGPGQIALRIEPRPSCGCNSQKAAAPKSGCKCGKCGGQAAAPRSGCGCGQKAARQVKSGCGCGQKAAAPKSGCKCGKSGGQAATPQGGCGCGKQTAAKVKAGCGGGCGGGKAMGPQGGCGCGKKAAAKVKAGCGGCGGGNLQSIQILRSPVQLRLRGKVETSSLRKAEQIQLRQPAIKKDVGCEKCRSKHVKDLTKVSEECLKCLERKLLSDGELSIGVLVPEKPKSKPKPEPRARSL